MKEKRIENRTSKMDFTTGSILKKLVDFMIPILGALILQTMYGAVDIIVVGWFGTEEGISAVSTGSSLINMVVFILSGLAMGVTVLMSQYLGEKNGHKLNQVIGGAIFIYAVISAVMMAFLIVCAPVLSTFMQAPEAALEKTILYIRICGGGIVFIIGYNLISSIFRGIGNAKLPLIFVAIACAVNVAADLLFVAVLRWDVAGAALATVMAQAVSLILSIRVCRKIELPFTIRVSDIRMNPEVKKFMRLGLPIAFQEFLTQLSFMCLVSFINGMGSTEAIRLASSSGYGVANKLVAVVMLVPSALMQSMSSFIGQNVGAGKEKRSQKAMGYGMLIGGCIGIVMTAAAFFGGQAMASLFTNDLAYQMKAAEYLKGFSLEAIITSILFSFIGYYNGHNQTMFVMLQGLAQSFIIRLPMAYVMSRLMPDSLVYVGAAAPTATMFGIVMNLIYFLSFSKKELMKTGEWKA